MELFMLNHEIKIKHLKTLIGNSGFKPRNARTLIIILLLLWAMSISLYQIKQAKAQTLHVGPTGPPTYDYEKIQDAVGNATGGDTIQVAAGIYYEHVRVNKSLTITGENPQTTIVDGSGNGIVFDLDANNIRITGFTIRNAGINYSAITIARDVSSTDFDVISNNIITTSLNGVYITLSDQNTISNNNITTTGEYGIYLSGSHRNTISSNTFIDNPFGGIYMTSASYENITGNTIKDSAHGIKGATSLNNIIIGNTITQTSYAIHLTSSSTGNTIRRNVVSGKTAGIYTTSDNTIADHNTAIDGSSGIYFANCKNGSIYYNTIMNSSYGIRLWSSSAMTTSHKVNNNKIVNTDWGIYLESSNGNTLTGNWLQQNTWGVYMIPSFSNTIYHNDFVLNDRGASVAAGSGNIWDLNGQGNYWSDYPASGDTDGDGIGETPYQIPPGADNNPLINTWSEHDIGIQNVSASPTEVNQGAITNITVKIRNNANITISETFTVTAYYSTTPIGTITVSWEYIYRDVDTSLKVSVGDVRLTAVGPYPAGSTVAAGNSDIGQNLVAFASNEKHRENVATNNLFDPEEYIYRDVNTDGKVSVDDVRLTPVGSYAAGSVVATGNSDINQNLVTFTSNEKHQENVAINNLYEPGLDSGKTIILTFKWNTTGVPAGDYTIKAEASIVPDELYTDNNKLTDGTVTVTIIHDIAVRTVTNSRTIGYAGYGNIYIKVDVKNEGTVSETFDVTVYRNSTIIETQTTTVDPGANKTLTFTWDLSAATPGYYNILATAGPVAGELDLSDNSLNGNAIRLRIPGDVNGDRTVDILDVSDVSAHWYPGPPIGPSGYDSSSDINNDGAIDIVDVAIVSANWGRTET